MSKFKSNSWKLGDYFLVPQSDGQTIVGQIVAIEPSALNSLVATFYDTRLSAIQEKLEHFPARDRIFSILLVTRDLLDSGIWRIVGNGTPVGLELFEELPRLRAAGFVGAKIIGSGIVMKFINAFYGLHPWDKWKNPQYLDGLLL